MEKDNIKDDEIRIIKRKEAYESSSSIMMDDSECSCSEPTRVRTHSSRKKWSVFAYMLFGGMLLLIGWLWYGSYAGEDVAVESAFEPELVEYPVEDVEKVDVEEKVPFGTYDDTVKTKYVEVVNKEVNDIPIDIFIPHNSTPVLKMGLPSEQDKDVILVTQAADLRADNGKIVGAFVLAGEPLSWGLSKKGYCAILDGKVTVGMADNSPLFEEATEKGGYFFRQYALVSEGKLVENNLRNKSIRKALCMRGDEVFVAVTRTRESMHDFSQALVDLGVDNAIYIVGSYSYTLYRDKEGVSHRVTGQLARINMKNVNFIEWR